MTWQAAPRNRIGIVLPSSNTVLEPLAHSQLIGTGISAHVSRLGVVDVSLDPASLAQFQLQRHIEAVRLLVDAAVDVVVWGGTSSSWLGFEHDREWCKAVRTENGVSANTCVLEMNRRLAECGAKRIGLVTPYTADIQSRIIENYFGIGFDCLAEAHHGGTLSNDYASISPSRIADMVRSVAKSGPDAILIMCTNMRGAEVAEALERELMIPIIDSAAATVWAGLRCLTEDVRGA
jgi:maleate isomerase